MVCAPCCPTLCPHAPPFTQHTPPHSPTPHQLLQDFLPPYTQFWETYSEVDFTQNRTKWVWRLRAEEEALQSACARCIMHAGGCIWHLSCRHGFRVANSL